MKSWEYKAVVYDGAVYCVECCPFPIDSDEVFPVFADSEWDYYPSCDKCCRQHDYVRLTTEGMEYERLQSDKGVEWQQQRLDSRQDS